MGPSQYLLAPQTHTSFFQVICVIYTSQIGIQLMLITKGITPSISQGLLKEKKKPDSHQKSNPALMLILYSH